jgi:peptide/nickel transport system permease protein
MSTPSSCSALPTTLFVDRHLADPGPVHRALPVGVYAATRPYSVFDQIANTLAFVGFSLPTFFTGLLLILLFSIKLDWLPFVFRRISASGWRWYWEMFRQAIMPITVLGLFQGASLYALRPLRRARRDPARLCDDGARQGPQRAGSPSGMSCATR